MVISAVRGFSSEQADFSVRPAAEAVTGGGTGRGGGGDQRERPRRQAHAAAAEPQSVLATIRRPFHLLDRMV